MQGYAQYPAFAPAPQKQQLGFWLFCILWLIICPNCGCMQFFLVSCSFFVFCCSRRCLSRCQHSSQGPQVSACLRDTRTKPKPRPLIPNPSLRLSLEWLQSPPRAYYRGVTWPISVGFSRTELLPPIPEGPACPSPYLFWPWLLGLG